MREIRLTCVCLALLLCASGPLNAAEANDKATTIDLAAEANRSAANDLGRAVLYVEASEADPGPLSAKLNQSLAKALATARSEAQVKARSGGVSTWPNYARNGGKIESWRMRAELVLESRDLTALAALLGKLQAGGMALTQMEFSPAPETRKKAEDETIADAINAFRTRAEVAANAMGRKYRIRSLSIQTSGSTPPPPNYARVKAMSVSDAAPMPLEAGDSQITVAVSGQIELQ